MNDLFCLYLKKFVLAYDNNLSVIPSPQDLHIQYLAIVLKLVTTLIECSLKEMQVHMFFMVISWSRNISSWVYYKSNDKSYIWLTTTEQFEGV